MGQGRTVTLMRQEFVLIACKCLYRFITKIETPQLQHNSVTAQKIILHLKAPRFDLHRTDSNVTLRRQDTVTAGHGGLGLPASARSRVQAGAAWLRAGGRSGTPGLLLGLRGRC
jgi:hypothetical protein